MRQADGRDPARWPAGVLAVGVRRAARWLCRSEVGWVCMPLLSQWHARGCATGARPDDRRMMSASDRQSPLRFPRLRAHAMKACARRGGHPGRPRTIRPGQGAAAKGFGAVSGTKPCPLPGCTGAALRMKHLTRHAGRGKLRHRPGPLSGRRPQDANKRPEVVPVAGLTRSPVKVSRPADGATLAIASPFALPHVPARSKGPSSRPDRHVSGPSGSGSAASMARGRRVWMKCVGYCAERVELPGGWPGRHPRIRRLSRSPISPLAGKMPDRAEGGEAADREPGSIPPSVTSRHLPRKGGDQGRAAGLARPSDPAARGEIRGGKFACQLPPS